MEEKKPDTTPVPKPENSAPDTPPASTTPEQPKTPIPPKPVTPTPPVIAPQKSPAPPTAKAPPVIQPKAVSPVSETEEPKIKLLKKTPAADQTTQSKPTPAPTPTNPTAIPPTPVSAAQAPPSSPSEQAAPTPTTQASPSPSAQPAPASTAQPTTQSGEVQVLAPDQSRVAASLITQPATGLSRLAFWRRNRYRDEQLTRISEGYVELIELVRSIKDQADSQHQNNVILRDSLAHLPEAIKSLEGFGKSHEQVGGALEKIHIQMQNYTAKDERLASSMDGFNDTLKGMDDTSKATIQTFDRVQERMRDSDIRMENLFNNVRNTEEKVSDTMVRLQRNMSIMQTFFMICLLGAIGGLIYTLLNKQTPELPPGHYYQAPPEIAPTAPVNPYTPDQPQTPKTPPTPEPKVEAASLPTAQKQEPTVPDLPNLGLTPTPESSPTPKFILDIAPLPKSVPEPEQEKPDLPSTPAETPTIPIDSTNTPPSLEE